MLPLEFSGSETVKSNKITLQAAEQRAFTVRFLNGKQISTDDGWEIRQIWRLRVAVLRDKGCVPVSGIFPSSAAWDVQDLCSGGGQPDEGIAACCAGEVSVPKELPS